jgi:hypothetical protein
MRRIFPRHPSARPLRAGPALSDAFDYREQTIERHDQHVEVPRLKPTRAHDAHDWQHPGRIASPATCGPARSRGGSAQVLLVKRPRFGLDRKSDAGRRPDEMIDVPTARPAHTVPHFPPAVGQPPQSMLDRSLCVGTHTPAVGDALRTAGPPKQGGPEKEEREDSERVSPDPRSAQAGEEDQCPAEQISVASDSMPVLLTTREGHAWREHTATSLELDGRQLSCCKVVTVLAH